MRSTFPPFIILWERKPMWAVGALLIREVP
jgi:hypothetical protein